MRMQKWVVILVVVAIGACFVLPLHAQEERQEKQEEKKEAYQFTIEHELETTPVKNQAATSTCWCFATISFFETEALRKGKGATDLSEMFVVRHTYRDKAESYVRLHGNTIFAGGGASHDVTDMMKKYGLVPEETYPGNEYESKAHNHGELTGVLRGMLDAVIGRRSGQLSPVWPKAIEAVLDTYFGEVPKTFKFKDKKYNPRSFMTDYLELVPEEYIEITSYTHLPFYQQGYLALPDNWTFNDEYYNVPMEDLERIVDHSIENGYSVVWGGDVSNRHFSTSKTGYGIVPAKDYEDMTPEERQAKITEPVEEKTISQELRQTWFDNYTSTDDHAMHITGIAHDQKGNKFYLTKNSHGVEGRKFDGYVYLSKPYMMYYVTVLMVNKNSLPSDIKEKFGF